MLSMSWTIEGHDWAVDMLRQHIARDAVRHAYLFTGSPGVGRRTLALQFAQEIICKNPLKPYEPGEESRIRQQIERMQHADLSVVVAERESGSLKVEQVRELQHTLALSPYQSRYRIALLLRFEEATTSAQNALLKTLEEAPEKVILLLTADSAENLLPTIVSRCEILRLRPLPIDNTRTILQARGIPEEEALRLAHLSGGRLGYALRMQQDNTLILQIHEQVETALQLLAGKMRERIAFANRFRSSDTRSTARQTLQTWLLFWRDVLLVTHQAEVPLIFLDWKEKTERLAGQVTTQEAQRQVAELEMALHRLENTNVNAQHLFEVVLLGWPKIQIK